MANLKLIASNRLYAQNKTKKRKYETLVKNSMNILNKSNRHSIF